MLKTLFRRPAEHIQEITLLVKNHGLILVIETIDDCVDLFG